MQINWLRLVRWTKKLPSEAATKEKLRWSPVTRVFFLVLNKQSIRVSISRGLHALVWSLFKLFTINICVALFRGERRDGGRRVWAQPRLGYCLDYSLGRRNWNSSSFLKDICGELSMIDVSRICKENIIPICQSIWNLFQDEFVKLRSLWNFVIAVFLYLMAHL